MPALSFLSVVVHCVAFCPNDHSCIHASQCPSLESADRAAPCNRERAEPLTGGQLPGGLKASAFLILEAVYLANAWSPWGHCMWMPRIPRWRRATKLLRNWDPQLTATTDLRKVGTMPSWEWVLSPRWPGSCHMELPPSAQIAELGVNKWFFWKPVSFDLVCYIAVDNEGIIQVMPVQFPTF